MELAAAKQEVQRLHKEREGDRSTINELRRVEDDREEELEWERGERKKAEEQKKLWYVNALRRVADCLSDLALEEYQNLVRSLDPTAVPPATPTSSVPNILQSVPELSTSAPLTSPTGTTVSSSESIPYLLLGQKGVHQLFNDFTSTLSAKEKALHSAHGKIEELEHSQQILKDQLSSETTLRVTAQGERDAALRDDGSAAKVVERYMTFTQKTHATVHMHLDNLRKRSAATQNSLRSELTTLRQQNEVATARGEKLRLAVDEMSEGMSRESAGRRREIALRLKMLSNDEKRARKVEHWLDKVRRTREGAEGAVVEPDVLEVLLDEGVDAVTAEQEIKSEKRSWKGILGKKKVEYADRPSSLEESVARVLLAEELVDTLVKDLQAETERRMELEQQRVAWLAKDAVDGVQPEQNEEDALLMFEVENEHDEKLEVPTPPPRTPSPLPDLPPLLPQLQELFEPLTDRFSPMQKSLHDLSHSLTALKSSLPVPPTPAPHPKRPVISLGRRPATADPVFLGLMESIHEVIEDARVDVEIALADEERVYRGFEALLGVGKSGAVQGKQVMNDAREYIHHRLAWEGFTKLQNRVRDVESDLTVLKRTIHELEGMEIEKEDELSRRSPWAELDLKTVSATRSMFSSSPLPSPFPHNSPLNHENNPMDGLGKRRAVSGLLNGVGSVGRSFSSSVIGAPRRVGTFAGGMVRGASKSSAPEKNGHESEKMLGSRHSEDDVE